MNNPREFNNVYTVKYIAAAQSAVAINKKNYFTGYPFLRYITPKAISINDILNSDIRDSSYINISDVKGAIRLFNYSMSDLYLTDSYPKAKLRLVNIEGIDLLNSYWLYTGTVPFSVVKESTLFTLSFYY
jgi:hypothetical protein